MEYKLIKKFLPELKINGLDIIQASDLEAELAKGVEVFGLKKDTANCWIVGIDKPNENITHSGLLLNYKPIESSKPVSREEIVETLLDHNMRNSIPKIQALIDRINKNGVK